MTKYLLNFILAILIIYSLVLIYIYIFQRNLLYHPKENNYLDNQIDFEYKEIFIPVNENIKLKSWIIEKDFKKNKTLIFFHGNAGNLNNRIYKVNELYNLILFIGIFLTQWGIGLIIDFAQFLGFSEIFAFQISFFVFLLSCIFSYIYFINFF